MPLFASGAGSPRIEQSGGRITIVAEEVTLGSIAEELSRKAGITVYLDRSEETRKVSVDVKAISFEKGVKTVVYPLNYAIVADRDGRIIELRIFKNTGTKDNAYKVFAAPKASETQVASQVASIEPSRQASAGSAVAAQGSPMPASAPPSSGKTPQPVEGLAGPSALVTGERAFRYNMWVNQRMIEAEQMRQGMRVKADQTEAQERQAAAVIAMTQISSNAQQTNVTAPQEMQAAMTVQQGQTQTQSFMQSSAQQRGFSNYMYYQQRAMRDSYSIYNVRRGQ
jgi:hypothetical protein